MRYFAELDNALNNTKKAIAARFDFRGATAELTLDTKEKKLKIVADWPSVGISIQRSAAPSGHSCTTGKWSVSPAFISVVR